MPMGTSEGSRRVTQVLKMLRGSGEKVSMDMFWRLEAGG
jgi:hypothetical protein